MIERANLQEQKIKMDGQMRLVEDGSRARKYLESYVSKGE